MNWWYPHNFDEKRHFLDGRIRIIKTLRRFFDAQDFAEVQTSQLQICPTIDAHIHGFKIEDTDLYLHTSPEFDMKKLLAAGMPKIYQICPVFRKGDKSALHSPEFTLLEWYRSKVDYLAIMNDCIDLLREIAKTLDIKEYIHKGASSNPFGQWQKITVCEAFSQYAGINLPHLLNDLDGFSTAANDIGVRVIKSDAWDDIFHAIMAQKIEPYLGIGAPTILYDYPIEMASLSRSKAEDPRFAERFELYLCGIELANAFSELTDAKEQRARYKSEMVIKQKLYGNSYPPDEDFFKALEHGMPDSAGIALGVDRLVMLAMGAQHINDVLWIKTPHR